VPELIKLAEVLIVRLCVFTMISDRIRAIPGSMEIIRHDVDPINALGDCLKVEMPQIPVGCGSCETDDPLELSSKIIDQLGVIDSIVIVATSISRTRVFLWLT
jgi:hypothetical protein